MSNKKLGRIIVALSLIFITLCAIWFSVPLPIPAEKKPASCCSADTCATQHHHEAHSHATPTISEVKLANWYAWYNETYFRGKLPKNTKVRYASLHAQKLMGLTQHVGIDESQIFVITLDPEYNEAGVVAQITLLHEMTHIATWDEVNLDHGPRFRTEIKRLEIEGAFDGLL